MVIDDTINSTVVMNQDKTYCDDVSSVIPGQISFLPAIYMTSTKINDSTQARNGEQHIDSPIDYQGPTLNIAREEMDTDTGVEEMVILTVKCLYIPHF